ncbi:translation initiation factor IF-2 [Eubacterium sp. 14-2]|uniref:translation initiation factor IF-2 n=1 Tax=Eubacterium sp. 14-2 TaxID=1235790 RepID=UPI00033527E6|nr:translation initiation factor IF-2 [Eubacterium sp. 14-2]EOT25451.1 translation initiation factor IF-2 [Eubacterium sp. 14-2]
MAKVRIYEIANELKIQSKDVIEFLKEKNIIKKTASSAIEDDVIDMVKKRFNGGKTDSSNPVAGKKKEESPENVPPKGEISENETVKGDAVKAVKTETEKTEAGKEEAERPRKKSSITAVFNPQNSKTAPRRPARPQGERGARPQGERPARPQGERGARPQGERPARPQGERGARPQGERPARPQGERGARPQGDRNNRPQNGEKNIRAQEERGTRPQGDRNNRPQGDRGNRSQGDRNNRPQGDRNNRPQGDRNNRPQGERGARPQGDRNNRPQGDRNNRPQGDRNNRSFQNGRPGQKNRFEQEIHKMNQNAPSSSMEETRGKESRERENRKGGNQRHEKELMGRKKERFDNLEKKTRGKKPQQPQQSPKKEEETIKTITIPEKLTIRELADRMKIQPSVIIKKLFLQGNIVMVNSEIDFAAAEEIALEFNCICEQEEKIDVIAELLKEEEEDVAVQEKRPPVVCVMGHVDHGKTSLLDAIRDTHVIDREAGGITQHIGAYMVECNGEKITFLDTPGHEAFTAMRMRGANATDIAILVVAADDGVMPQTVEAISHAKAAGVEIIVAINKIDKPSANVERVKQELAEYELIPEDWGGSTIFVPVSAHSHEGIDTLLEMILLTAEICELKANPGRNARGLVIEAQLDKGRGSVATILVQKGTLKVGQPVACGSCYGKVRAMIDDKGRRVKEAGPSTPVEILGLNNVPNAGEIFVCTDSEKEAKSFADTFISEGREKMLEETKSRMSLDDLFSQIQSGNIKELPIIVKADVQGSVEAVKQSLVKLSNEEVVVKVIHGGVGAINESDVSLASASNAIIIGFNVRPDATAKATAEREGVDMRLYKVIYNAIEDVQAAMKGMLDPVFEEKVLGHAEVRQIFKASGVGNIAGSYVLDGVFQRGCKIRISRGEEQIFEGNLASLKRFKDDVKEVKAGYECGLVFEGFNDIQELDVVEAYTMVEVPR